MMRSNKSLKLGVSLIALLTLAASPACAGNGQWRIILGGNWSDSSKWLNGNIADGFNSTAYFKQNITANRTVTLDSDRTIGNLVFEDTGDTPDNRWTLRYNTLTLLRTGGAPTIEIGSDPNVPVYISTVLAGTQGFEKTGAGTLMINGAMIYTGDTVISEGNIRLYGDDYLPATSVLSLTGTNAAVFQMFGKNQTLGGLKGTNGTVHCNFNASSTNVLTLAVADAETYSFSGLLEDGHAESQLNIVKTGLGTQEFAGANNVYSGTTTVSAGTLIGGADGAFGTSSLTVESGAKLVLTNGVSNRYISEDATLALDSSATLDLGFVGESTSIGGLSLDGGATWLSDGVYNAADLQALGAGTCTGTGSLLVGEELVVVVGAVDIQSLAGANVAMTWSNTLGASYRVETNGNLVSGEWGTAQDNLTAAGGSISYTGSTTEARNFYRIVVE